MNIGKKIEALRIEKKMSQRDLAAKLNVSSSTISLWERDITTPRMDKLQQLSRIFGVNIAYFIEVKKQKDEEMVVAVFNALNEEGQTRLFEYAKMLMNGGYLKGGE